MPEIKIPRDVPDGPLRDYLEWLAALHRRAGQPSLENLSKVLKVSRPTVQRLFQRYPGKLDTAWKLIRHLAENPVVPTRRSEEEWDAFFEEGERLLEAAASSDTGKVEELEEVPTLVTLEGTDFKGQPFRESAIIPVKRKPSNLKPVDLPPVIGGSALLHVMGPTADPTSYEEYIDLAMSLADSGLPTPADGPPIVNAVHVNEGSPFGKLGRDIANHFLRPKFVLAVFEGFWNIEVDERGILLSYATSWHPIHGLDRFPTVSHLLPKARRAVVVLAGDKNRATRAGDDFLLDSISDGFGEVLLVEATSRAALGDVLSGMILNPHSRRGGPDALHHMADQASRLPDTGRVLLTGRSTP
ncbi:hypothetical protein [Streptomyces exfoliatus]|uniref:hypothetical protein n=1 Tax=Streptomyces exfoliatus TaxID=1905 RepID=UPI0012FF2478|nr:hypothetical protein [Streptomyces exfoliatus]